MEIAAKALRRLRLGRGRVLENRAVELRASGEEDFGREFGTVVFTLSTGRRIWVVDSGVLGVDLWVWSGIDAGFLGRDCAQTASSPGKGSGSRGSGLAGFVAIWGF